MEQNEKQEMGTMRPYEKFMAFGPQYLTESELLAVILRTGSKDEDAEQLASRILQLQTGSGTGLLALHHVSTEQLKKLKGIGQVKAIQLKCLCELCIRMSQQSAGEHLVFNRSGTVAAYYMERLRHKDRECVFLLLLDAKGRLIKETELSRGTVNISLLSPREVFIDALRSDAVQMILLHNHPSGDPTPSREDMTVTENIAKSGKMLNLPLVDHIIIGDRKYISFKEQGYL